MGKGLTVGQAAALTGWSARMLRYLETNGLVVPRRTASGYRVYAERELEQLRTLRELRERFGVELDELAFANRLRREPELRAAVDTWLASSGPAANWVDWEQRKHERLLLVA
ncbi:MAG TPA: MerR family transcriptional regulator [Gaiellaceae bacterium]|nr:MerR family transcriptional regulator [Gaiellaceae bacterium]